MASKLVVFSLVYLLDFSLVFCYVLEEIAFPLLQQSVYVYTGQVISRQFLLRLQALIKHTVHSSINIVVFGSWSLVFLVSVVGIVILHCTDVSKVSVWIVHVSVWLYVAEKHFAIKIVPLLVAV